MVWLIKNKFLLQASTECRIIDFEHKETTLRGFSERVREHRNNASGFYFKYYSKRS
jgi:hypothetical protein